MYSFSKGSWHYRLASYSYNYYIPTNLCPYVRRVLFGGFLLACISFIVGMILLFNILGIITAFQGIWWVNDVPSIYTMTNCVTIAVLLFVGFMTLMDYIKERNWRNERIKLQKTQWHEYTPSQPGLLTVYWRSFHDKICPQLTFTDKE